MATVGILILAAGGSARMGTAKQLLPIGNVTLLGRVVQMAMETRCEPVMVVLGSRSEEVSRELKNLPVTIVINPQWEAGIGSSIRQGMTAFSENKLPVRAVVILPCDQPLVSAELIDGLVDHHVASGKSITAAAYGGTLGTPAVFDIRHFPELMKLGNEEGGKRVIRAHPKEVASFPMPEAAMEVDTPMEYANLTRILTGQAKFKPGAS